MFATYTPAHVLTPPPYQPLHLLLPLLLALGERATRAVTVGLARGQGIRLWNVFLMPQLAGKVVSPAGRWDLIVRDAAEAGPRAGEAGVRASPNTLPVNGTANAVPV